MKRNLPRILAHAAIVLALVLITLLIFDYCNPTMDFINNAMTKGLIGCLCLISLFNVGLLLTVTRRGG